MRFDNTMNRHTQTLLATVLCKHFPITTIGNLILVSHGRSTFGCSSLAGNKDWVHAEAAATRIGFMQKLLQCICTMSLSHVHVSHTLSELEHALTKHNICLGYLVLVMHDF